MNSGGGSGSGNSCVEMAEEDDQMEMMEDLRRGPWTVEEDFTLINYIAHHGEGRWNSLARCAGLKRTGKSCRLRWLNYLRPDVRRGNITLEEQLLILELHSRWGNRWSKIAQHLPGRTDNEIKNYWRTRVQKHAKQLKCDVNSKQFKDTMRYLWMPRLIERIQAAATTTTATATTIGGSSSSTSAYSLNQNHTSNIGSSQLIMSQGNTNNNNVCAGYGNTQITPSYTSENSSTTAVSPVSDMTESYYPMGQCQNSDYMQTNSATGGGFKVDSLICPLGYFNHGMNSQAMAEQTNQWTDGNDNGGFSDNLWNVEDILFLQQQFDNM